MSDSRQPVLLVRRQDATVHLTLNRPRVLNALNRELLRALKGELEQIRDNPAVRAVIITGSGDRAFSAGADIGFLNTAPPLEVRRLALLALEVTHLLENLGPVTLALINGFALGGGLELAEACMLRIAVKGARLGHPEVRIGAVAGWGGTTRLPRLIGKTRATELLLTGESLDAVQALELGLVNRTAPRDCLEQEGRDLLQRILANGPTATRLTWQAIHRGLDLGVEESTRLGADLFGLAAADEDFREGTRAFLDRREPRFSGK